MTNDVFDNRPKREAGVKTTFARIIAMLDQASKATQCCITAIAIDAAITELTLLAKEYKQPVVEQMMLVEDEKRQTTRASSNRKAPESKPTPPKQEDWGELPF